MISYIKSHDYHVTLEIYFTSNRLPPSQMELLQVYRTPEILYHTRSTYTYRERECVCVRERERESVCVCVRERERVCVCEREMMVYLRFHKTVLWTSHKNKNVNFHKICHFCYIQFPHSNSIVLYNNI